MAKTLNEYAADLKQFIIDNQQTRNSDSTASHRYNNLKLSMDETDDRPQLKITIAISDATYNLNSGEKVNGSLGPEEKFVQRWLGKSQILTSLCEMWKSMKQNRGKLVVKEAEHKEGG